MFIFGFVYTSALGWIQNKTFPIVFLALGEAILFRCSREVLDEISAQTPTEFILFSSGPSVM